MSSVVRGMVFRQCTYFYYLQSKVLSNSFVKHTGGTLL